MGGFAGVGEIVEDAAVREAKEETGLDIELSRLAGKSTRTPAAARTAITSALRF